MSHYLRQFVEWGIASRARYKSDLFFRTTVHIILLQAGFALVCILSFWLALQFASQRFVILGVPVVAALIFGVALARFTLRPARDSLRHQKQFISNVAHEVRTPLSTIKTSTEVALLNDDLSAPLRKTFGEILEELARLSEIINNLLSLSTLTRPERMTFEHVDLKPIINNVIKQHAPLAYERSIKIIAKKDSNIFVWGNAVGLEQIMSNLLKNALSYTPKGGEGAVVITVQPDYHGMILLSIADNGIGIAKDDLFHIMEPFYRADTSRVRRIKKSGSGLGLTIVHEIVRAHHGRIHIQSAKGKGTTVSVFIPEGQGRQVDNMSETTIDFSKGDLAVAHTNV